MRKTLFSVIVLMLILSLLPVALAQDPNAFGYEVTFVGRTYDPVSNTTTFTYRVVGSGEPPALSHFDLEIPQCEDSPSLEVVSFSPTQAVQIGTDPNTGVNGIKWDFGLAEDGEQLYSITFEGDVVLGEVATAVKAGNGFETIILPGAACSEASIDIEKFLSIDSGLTWLDADVGTGPDVTLENEVSFRFVITNDGTVDLTNITVTDDLISNITCGIPETLAPAAFFECTAGPVAVVEGEYVNVATASAAHEDSTVSDSDSASYFGGDRPSINVEKLVSADGSTWVDADNAPGLLVEIGSPVHFQISVTNDGNVPLTSIVLTDNHSSLASCTVPAVLEPENGFTCPVGPLEAVEGAFVNTATAVAAFEDQNVTDTDSANYFGGEEDLPPIIIIEGPVEDIQGTIIIIFGIEIQLDPDDPLLAIILIGDFVHIEGDLDDDGNVIIVIAGNVTIINVNVFINDDGDAWRDDNCNNPPPPWAPAHGWRRKCE
ncbi:MAG: hypothetical protein L0154_20235 [Chloroflexi bacterium]|nr:hypothetical protein [Chloroflexota bacterium]